MLYHYMQIVKTVKTVRSLLLDNWEIRAVKIRMLTMSVQISLCIAIAYYSAVKIHPKSSRLSCFRAILQAQVIISN